MSIKAVDLNYVYGNGTAFEQHALFDVNFEIQDGEFVGIIGHTGSGKSTLIKILLKEAILFFSDLFVGTGAFSSVSLPVFILYGICILGRQK